MEKKSIVLVLDKYAIYRGLRVALSLMVFVYFSYSLWNKYEFGFSDDTVYLLYIAGSGAALSLAVLLGFCFDCFEYNSENWDRKRLMRGQGYMLAGAVIVQISMYLILYSMGNAFWAWEKFGVSFFTVYWAVILVVLLGLVFLVFQMRSKKGRFYIYFVQGIGIFYSMVIYGMFIGNIDEYEPYHFIIIPYITCFILSNGIYCVSGRKNRELHR